MDEEKVYCSMYSRNTELYHHGIKGQKWGVQNGPPYPLDSDVSTGKRLKKEANIAQSQFYSDKTKDNPKARRMEIWKNVTKMNYGIKGTSEEKGHHKHEVWSSYNRKLNDVWLECIKAKKAGSLTDELLWKLAKADWEEKVVWCDGDPGMIDDSIEDYVNNYGSIKKYGDSMLWKFK